MKRAHELVERGMPSVIERAYGLVEEEMPSVIAHAHELVECGTMTAVRCAR
jgi:hypothetical protein